MDMLKRRSLWALLGLPAGCAIPYLPPLEATPLGPGASLGPVRPPALGQRWTYQLLNVYNSQQLDTVTEEVVSLEGGIRIRRTSANQRALDDEWQPAWGQVVQDPYWDALQTYETPLPLWLAPFTPGSSQTIHTHYRSGTSSFRYWISARTTAVAWERLVLPSGTFQTVRVEKLIRLQHPDLTRLDALRRDTLWLAPETGRWVARETNGEFRMDGDRWFGHWSGREDHFRWQLQHWA
jgi:hypothetical protein